MKTQNLFLMLALAGMAILGGCEKSLDTGDEIKSIQVDANLKSFGSNEKVIKVACGGTSHSLVLTSNGNLYTVGDNYYGAMGINYYGMSPFLILTATGVKTMAGGQDFSLLVTNDGYVYATGENSKGQLGLGDRYDRTNWQATGLSNIKSVACGREFSLALTNDGYVFATGDNLYGQRGVMDTFGYEKNIWQKTSLSNIKSIACGREHSLALTNDGYVFAVGNNQYGQLGLGNYNNQYSWQQTNSGVSSIACGASFSLLVSSSADYVYATGDNRYGQLGLWDTMYRNKWERTNLSGVYSVAAGYYHSLAMKYNGLVYVTGRNGNGELGLGNTTNQNFWTQIGSLFGVKSISGGYAYSFATDYNGDVWATGSNVSWQLGFWDTNSRNSWEQVTTPYNPPATATVRLENYWKRGYFINVEDRIANTVECGKIDQGWLSAKWYMSKNSEGYYTFKCAWTKESPNSDGFDYYLHMEDKDVSSIVEWGKAYSGGNNGVAPNEGWWSAQWSLEPAIGYPICYRLKNRWTGRYLFIEHLYSAGNNPKSDGAVKLEHDPLSTSWDPDSGKWFIEIQ